jgi:hypothetical protein
VAQALGYADKDQAIRHNVDEEDRSKQNNLRPVNSTGLSHNEKQVTFINESGLYCLILASKKEQAKAFKLWVTATVLPTLRKSNIMRPFELPNETALHHKIVAFIRSYLPQALLSVGLGELQDTSSKRSDAYPKGYRGGAPDILILNHHIKYNGFAIELKTPQGSGVLSNNQRECLLDYSRANYKTMVSCEYDQCVWELIEYFRDVRLCCSRCSKKFKNHESLYLHETFFHQRGKLEIS